MNSLNCSYIGIRHDLIKYISEDKNNLVLDVGCATGVNGQYLLKNKKAKIVYGVEFNADMATKARANGLEIFEGDLNSTFFCHGVVKELPLLDYIILGDVLEHLYSPEDVLTIFTQKLKPNGKVIISLPNISHIELFIQVYIKGSWPQNQRGIFDKTHVRWFTKKDAINLVEKCQLEVQAYEPQFRARDEIGSTFNLKLKFLKRINKEWVTFQHILLCQHAR